MDPISASPGAARRPGAMPTGTSIVTAGGNAYGFMALVGALVPQRRQSAFLFSGDAAAFSNSIGDDSLGMLEACYKDAVSNLQIKAIPAELHRKLRAQARRQGRTLRDVVLEAVRREVEREEFRMRLATRRPVELGRLAAVSLEEVRAERDEALEK